MKVKDITVGDRLLVTDGAYNDGEPWQGPAEAYHFIRNGALVEVIEILPKGQVPDQERVRVRPVDEGDWLNDGVDSYNYVWPKHLIPVPEVDPADLGSVEAFLNG